MPSGMFDSAALESSVIRALDASPAIPDGAHGAFVTVCNSDGIKAVIAFRVAETWQISATGERSWRDDADVKVGVFIKGTF